MLIIGAIAVGVEYTETPTARHGVINTRTGIAQTGRSVPGRAGQHPPLHALGNGAAGDSHPAVLTRTCDDLRAQGGPMSTICARLLAAVFLLATVSPGLAADLDLGDESTNQWQRPDILRLVDCYPFGGSSQSFTGSGRGRGNTYTVSAPEELSEIKQELGFTGAANIYFYVLESNTLSGTYTVLSETIVPLNGTGQAFYSSGPISVPLFPGMFYGIGCAWGPESVDYFRDLANLPRNWALGTVEDSMQISAAPPYGSLTYNHFSGAEYSLELCFGPQTTPVEDTTWGNLKAVYR
jgi:hypothetical protein